MLRNDRYNEKMSETSIFWRIIDSGSNQGWRLIHLGDGGRSLIKQIGDELSNDLPRFPTSLPWRRHPS